MLSKTMRPTVPFHQHKKIQPAGLEARYTSLVSLDNYATLHIPLEFHIEHIIPQS